MFADVVSAQCPLVFVQRPAIEFREPVARFSFPPTWRKSNITICLRPPGSPQGTRAPATRQAVSSCCADNDESLIDKIIPAGLPGLCRVFVFIYTPELASARERARRPQVGGTAKQAKAG